MLATAIIAGGLTFATTSHAQQEPGKGKSGQEGKARPGQGQVRPGQGQGQRPQRGGGFSRSNPYSQLDLTEAQQKKMAALQQEQSAATRKMFEELRGGGGDREAMRAKFTEMREKTNKQIEAILTDEQKKKFKETQSQRPTRPQGRPGGEGKGKQRPGRSDA